MWASLVAQTVKNLPAMQKTRIPSLGREKRRRGRQRMRWLDGITDSMDVSMGELRGPSCAAAPGQSGMWTVLCDKQAWEAARPRRGGVPQEGLKLKLQYFGHLMRSVDSLEKTLMLGGIGGRRRRG